MGLECAKAQAIPVRCGDASGTMEATGHRPALLEFFAGSGLVSFALSGYCRTVWSDDTCTRKAAISWANHRSVPFHLGSIAKVSGKALPAAPISWGSFPCQDLSLAGQGEGIQAKRSGLVWEWLRVVNEMPERPSVLALKWCSASCQPTTEHTIADCTTR